MMTCNKCGRQVDDGVKFCSGCGENLENSGGTAASQAVYKGQATQGPGTTANDVDQNKVMAVLAYLGILVLVSLFGAKESKFARYHANQGLILCICEVIYIILNSIISSIFYAISWRLEAIVSPIFGLISIAFLALAIIGIVNAAGGKEKPLPIIGGFRILK